MSSETLKRDQNFITVLGGVTNDADQDIKMLRVDPITKRLLVAASGVDLSVTLADVSANSTTTPNSLYTMTSTIPVEFRRSGGSTLLYLDETNGFMGVGYSVPATELSVFSTSSSDPRGIMSAQYSTDTSGARIHFRKARGTPASPTIIVTGDMLGRLRFSGYDGASYLQMGSIDVVSTGTIGTNRVPTYMTFSVATDASPSVLTERMRITAAGLVGIGNTAPTYLVDILNSANISATLSISNQGGGGSSDPAIRLQSTGSNDTWFFGIDKSDSNKFKFANSTSGLGTTDRVTIDSSGNVGIGNTSPGVLLSVLGTAGSNNALGDFIEIRKQTGATPTAGLGGALVFNTQDSGFTNINTGRIGSIATDVTPGAVKGALVFQTKGSGSLTLGERMRIDDAGNVGIGTTVPVDKLQVAGRIVLGNTTTGAVAGQATFLPNNGSNWFHLDNRSDSTLRISTGSTVGATDLVTFKADGNVGIGTTGPNYVLDVAGSTASLIRASNSGGNAQIQANASSGSYGYVRLNAGTTFWDVAERDTEYSGALQFRFNAGAPNMVIQTGGNVGIGTTGPDAKLDVLSTTEQLRLTYTDGSVYTSFTTNSGGDLTIAPSGGDTTVTGTLAASTYFLRSVGNGLTAAGSSRTDALQLAKEINNVTTAAAGTGVILPTGVVGMRITVFNNGANAAQVYANGSETIDGTAGSTGVPLTNAKRCEYFFVASNTWISAQLGVISA